MIDIVDHRNEDKTLSKFGSLPGGCIFELPDKSGLYMKLKNNCHVHYPFSCNEFDGMNAIVLQPSYIGDGDWLAVEDWVMVRALDTELHILEAKKYD
jgi:hypothetical protein